MVALGFTLGWLSYWFQRVSLADTKTRLLCLSSFSFSNVFIGAALYRAASGSPWSSSLFKTYAVLFRVPGVGTTNEQTLLASLVIQAIFIFGLFVFAAFLGMISDEIKQQLHAIRAGEVQLPLSQHVVVLNWNAQALSLLKQLSHAQSDRSSRLYGRPIVVLAEPSKANLDAAVAAVFKRGSKQLRLFCRSGRPAKARDLESVAAEAADTVIVLHPDGVSSKAAADALKATALVSLTCLRGRALGRTRAPDPTAPGGCAGVAQAACRAGASLWQAAAATGLGSSMGLASNSSSSSSPPSMRIVVQMASSSSSSGTNTSTSSSSSLSPSLPPSSSCCSLAEGGVIGFLQDATASSFNSGSIQQVQLLSKNTLDRLVCQTAAEPGVATVFRELVRAGGDVHLDWCEVTEQLAGSYGSAAKAAQGCCVLLGVLAADSQQLTLNPPDHLLLQPGDRLVALTRQQGILAALTACSGRSKQRPIGRTVSRLSSMASPHQWATAGSSSSEGGSSSSSSPSKAGRGVTERSRRVIVVGWAEAAIPDLLLQLQEAMPRGGHITVVLPAQAQPPGAAASGKQPPKQQGSAKAPASLWHVQYCHVADPSSAAALREAGTADADAVIVGSALSAAVPPGSMEADALVTATMLAIQQAVQGTSRQDPAPLIPQQQQSGAAAAAPGDGGSSMQPPSKLHVVAVVCSYSVRRALQTFLSCVLLQCSFSYEIMVLDEFAAGMLASVAVDTSNSLVIDQLLLQPRSSLGMWSLQKLGLDPSSQQLTFQGVCEAARRHRCTALGYRRWDGRMVLVPSPGAASLTAEDRVVVLARAGL